ncbi:MAG: hypothetical protein ACKPH3_18515 [Dolichospermum sp.]
MNRLPNEDLSSSQIAKFLNVSRKTVTSYYEKVREAYYWLLESELRYGASNQIRYTKFCVAAIEDLCASDNHQKWVNDIKSAKLKENNISNDFAPKGEIVISENLGNLGSSDLIIPNVNVLEVEVIDAVEVKNYDLSIFTNANLNNVANLRTNENNKFNFLEESAIKKFELMGKKAAQQAIYRYTKAFSDELTTLTGE